MINYRRFFIKTLLKLGLISLLPVKIFALNDIEDCDITTDDIEGPYYAGNYTNSYNITPFNIDDPAQNFLIISGTVYAEDCKTPIPNAVVEIWHANQGVYDIDTNQYLDSEYEDDFYRGQINTDSAGNYSFLTVLPGKYPNGSYYRPSHIHYKTSYLDTELTTQVYFEGDTSIPIDPWASNPNATNRIISLFTDANNVLNGVFDINLNINPENINNTYLKEQDKIIKSIWPNPINQNTTIILNKYEKNTQIKIYDINGQIITRKTILGTEIKLMNIIKKPLTKGFYILQISTPNGLKEVKRFIV